MVLYDSINILFSGIVLSIGIRVLFFRYLYMQSAIFKKRFYALIFFFILAINILIISPSMWGIIVG